MLASVSFASALAMPMVRMKSPEAILLMGEHMLDDGGAVEDLAAFALAMFCGIGFARGLAAMDAADQHLRRQPFLVLLRTVGAVGEDLR